MEVSSANIEMQRSCEGKLFEDMLVELIHMILRFSMDQTLTFTACWVFHSALSGCLVLGYCMYLGRFCRIVFSSSHSSLTSPLLMLLKDTSIMKM